MTTVPGSRAGASWVSMQVSKAVRSMAPAMTEGAIRPAQVRPAQVRPAQVRPAMKVWVCQRPKGAEPVSRWPRAQRPRSRVMVALTEVSSIKTSRSGQLRMIG